MFNLMHVHFNNLRLALLINSLRCEGIAIKILEKLNFFNV